MSTVCVNLEGGGVDCGWWWWSQGVGAEEGTLASRWGNSGCAVWECDLGSGD